MDFIKIAFRNIFRQKRRSIINIISIVVGISLLLIVLCGFEGWIRHTTSLAINKSTGHIQIENKEYQSNSRRLPLDINVNNTKKIISLISKVNNVLFITPRLDFSAYLSNKIGKMYLTGRAIDPEKEAEVTQIKKQIIKGNYLTINKPTILISKNTAEKLQLDVGDFIFVNAINRYGHLNPMEFKVAGIFNFSYPSIDYKYFFIDYQTAQDLLFTEGDATRLVIRIKEGASLDETMEDIKKVLPSNSNLVVKGWQEFLGALISEIYGDSISVGFMIFILLLITAFSIINTMSMAVNERKTEIGTLRAIGMKKRSVFYVFLLESLSLGLIGAIIAIIISLPINLTLSNIGFRMSQQSLEVMRDIPIGTEPITGHMALWHYILGLTIALLTTFIGGIMPARRAAKMKPVDALKTI